MKDYVKPMMESEVFAANEYIAACGSGTTYLFTCNAGGGKVEPFISKQMVNPDYKPGGVEISILVDIMLAELNMKRILMMIF